MFKKFIDWAMRTFPRKSTRKETEKAMQLRKRYERYAKEENESYRHRD